MKRIAGIAAALAGTASLLLAAGEPAPSGPPEVTLRSQEAARRGREWLLQNQNPDGSWGCIRGQPASTSVTSLAALALMANGETPSRGQRAADIKRAVDWLLRVGETQPNLATNEVTGLGPVFDHSTCVMFLGQAVGSLAPEDEGRARRVLAKAAQQLAAIQNPDGGFGQGQSDLGVSGMAWNGLRAARDAGVTVRGTSVDRLVEFARRCAQGGGFVQFPSQGDGGNPRAFYPTAAGARILMGAGKGDELRVQQGLETMSRLSLGADYGGRVSEWCYPAALYGTQALLLENGRRLQRWYPSLRDRLVSLQAPDGSWNMQYCSNCKAFATAIALLVLEAPYRQLPMFEW